MSNDLYANFEKLNTGQKDAVLSSSNTVVLAGPGSGKTNTLVFKAIHLLSSEVAPPQGIACLTFNNDTAKEFSTRLENYGIFRNKRIFLGTTHSFCLNAILRPYLNLIMPEFKNGVRAAGPKRAQILLDEVVENQYPEVMGQKVGALTLFRRRRICREDISDYPDDFIGLTDAYRKAMFSQGVVDFEEMTALGLLLIQNYEWVRNGIAARYPWILIDEYQDLGGPLHQIVLELVTQTGIKIFAVGDPDQSIYPFNGADPAYFIDLSQRNDFETVELEFNYRSGKIIMQVAEAALQQQRNYLPGPDVKDEGKVYIENVPGRIAGQANFIATNLIPELAKSVPLEEIAILYKGRGRVPTSILAALAKNGIEFNSERDERYPRNPLIRWLQDCAVWCISETSESNISFNNVLRFYHNLLVSSGEASRDNLEVDRQHNLYKCLTTNNEPEQSLSNWLGHIIGSLRLTATLQNSLEYADYFEDLSTILELSNPDGRLSEMTLTDFSSEGKIKGRVVVTTYHSSKGRQFHSVIMPALQETLIPYRKWSRRDRMYEPPTENELGESRRLFYVGLTRAISNVFLLYSDEFRNHADILVSLGPSSFISEVEERLALVEASNTSKA